MQKITPFLWFDDQAEEAAKFYVSIFKNSKIGKVARYGEAGAKVSGRPQGSVMTVAFQLEAQDFIALNGGPQLLSDPDPVKSERVMNAMLQMKKIDIKRLEQAYRHG